MSKELISIEVAYALPDRQKILPVQVSQGTTAYEVAEQSGIASHFPGLDLSNACMGIFGNELGSRGLAAPKDYQVKEGDRIEIYRPLIADPKEVRRQRAEEAKRKRAESAAEK